MAADKTHQISDGDLAGVDIPGQVAEKIAGWKGVPRDHLSGGTEGLYQRYLLKEVTAKFYLEGCYTEEKVKEFIECESDNEAVAVVENGTVKAIGPGECNIRFYAECAGGGLIEKDCKVKVTDGEWKEAYAKIMRNYRDERSSLATRFTIKDMDGDGVPELFLTDGNFRMSQCTSLCNQ